MAGPGGWRDKEVTDLGHLPVSRGRPSPPKCSLLRALSTGVGDGLGQAGLGQKFDGTMGAERDPRSWLVEKALPRQTPGRAKFTKRQSDGGGEERRGGSGVVRALKYGTFSSGVRMSFCLAVLGYLYFQSSRRGQRARRCLAS